MGLRGLRQVHRKRAEGAQANYRKRVASVGVSCELPKLRPAAPESSTDGTAIGLPRMSTPTKPRAYLPGIILGKEGSSAYNCHLSSGKQRRELEPAEGIPSPGSTTLPCSKDSSDRDGRHP